MASSDEPLYIQITRSEDCLFLRNLSPSLAAPRFTSRKVGHRIPRPLSDSFLRQMDLASGRRFTGMVYGHVFHRCYRFLFEICRDTFSVVGTPCTPAQAESRFISCSAPDISAQTPYTAIMLHHTDHGYIPCPYASLTPAARHMFRRSVYVAGSDFPEICFHRGGPVYWFRFWRYRLSLQCEKIYLLPLCASARQVLMISRVISPENIPAELCITCPVHDSLTSREQQALTLAGQNMPNRAIARLMQIQEGTVKKLLSNAYAKSGISSRYDLLRRLKP